MKKLYRWNWRLQRWDDTGLLYMGVCVNGKLAVAKPMNSYKFRSDHREMV